MRAGVIFFVATAATLAGMYEHSAELRRVSADLVSA
jgi:hypothetical protein